MLQIYQHWDPLQACVVGSCWPPEFFSYVQDSKLRNLLEKIVTETQEDLDALAQFIESRGVQVFRPDVGQWHKIKESIESCQVKEYPRPPVCPRDAHVMIGDLFYINRTQDSMVYADHYDEWPGWPQFYQDVRQSGWPDCSRERDFKNLPEHIQSVLVEHCQYLHWRNESWYAMEPRSTNPGGVYDHIYQWIIEQGNQIVDVSDHWQLINGSMVTRLGRDLYFSTESYDQITDELQSVSRRIAGTEFRPNIIDCGGHSDGTFCPVAPGLIVSYHDRTTYEQSFPGWEIVYGSDQSYLVESEGWRRIRQWGFGRWYLRGQERTSALTDFVDTYLRSWTGNALETRFFVNILMIDPKTAVVAQYDENIVRAMERYGITCHVIPSRHQFFWDAGTHCHTLDLARLGAMQDYFPDRDCASDSNYE